MDEYNGAFIAAAHTDVPALARYALALEARVAELEARLKTARNDALEDVEGVVTKMVAWDMRRNILAAIRALKKD